MSILLLTFSLLPTAYATNGYFAHGTGIKNRALAGAGVAFPQDAMAGATNPAGMSFVGNRFDIGTVIFFPDRSYSSSPSLANGTGGAFTIGPDSETSGDKWFLIPSFGINKDINEKTSIGLSFYGNGGLNTSYDGGSATFNPGTGTATFPGVFGAGTASIDIIQAFFNLSISHKITENFSIGVSPIFAIQSFRSNGLDNFAPFTKTFAESGGTVMPNDLTSNGADYSYGGGVQVGILVKDINGFIDFGASYRSRIYMSKFDKYSDLFADGGDFDVPPTLWLGFALKATSSLTFVFDFQRIWHEDIDSLSNDVQNLFSCPTLGGTDLSSCLGGSDGGGFGWRNINIYKLGMQWQTSDQHIFRAGFSHSDQPIPDDQVTFNILAPAVVENHITAGYTYVFNDKSEINLEAMHAFQNSIKGTNAFDPTQTIEIEMQQFEIGISWSKPF
ncbi:MAG: outer membrane protein transport protein [Pseudomonadota bacterium]